MIININQLSAEITRAVKEYTAEVTEGIVEEIDQTSKAIVKAIRAGSPRESGDYAKGWTRKKMGSGQDVSYVVYNKEKPWISHLLEYGHVKRGGGRVSGRPHIRPVTDREIAEMERRVRSIIETGGR